MNWRAMATASSVWLLVTAASLALSAPSSSSEDWRGCAEVPVRREEHQRTYYTFRDNRCEGVYEANQSGSASRLQLAFIGVRAPAARGARQLHLAWRPVDGEVRIFAEAIDAGNKPRYRLLTHQPGQIGRFQWPADVMQAAGADPARLALHVSIADDGAPGGRRYVPATFSSSGVQASGENYTAEIVPVMRLVRASFTLVRREGSGWAPHTLDKGIESTVLPERVPFTVPLGALSAGTYWLTVSTTAADNSKPPLAIWFVVPSQAGR